LNLVHARVKRFRAGRDGRKRVVDFMNDPRREPSNRSELFGVDDRFVHLLLFRHVLAHSDDVSHLRIIDSHGNLADLPNLPLTLVP